MEEQKIINRYIESGAKEPIHPSIKKAIIAVQKEAKSLVKDGQYLTQYKYTSWHKVVGAINTLMAKHGLSVHFNFKKVEINKAEGLIRCAFNATAITEEGEYTWPDQMMINDLVPKQTYIKQIGAFQSYARKYFYIQLFNLITSDPDADASEFGEKVGDMKTSGIKIKKPLGVAPKKPLTPAPEIKAPVVEKMTDEQYGRFKIFFNTVMGDNNWRIEAIKTMKTLNADCYLKFGMKWSHWTPADIEKVIEKMEPLMRKAVPTAPAATPEAPANPDDALGLDEPEAEEPQSFSEKAIKDDF